MAAADSSPDEYHAHRVALGVPEGGRDFVFNDAFPHEALMDQLGGVDFDKGCYVGQEVVSRMQHRGTARTRVVRLRLGAGEQPGGQADILAGDRSLGRTGSVAGDYALATVRLDRAADALTGGQPILAGGVPVAFDKPDWVRFPYPADLAAS
jgi:folate-binding protein YgfZ